jgi:poly(3-hydroxybutyrate) depolymerase
MLGADAAPIERSVDMSFSRVRLSCAALSCLTVLGTHGCLASGGDGGAGGADGGSSNPDGSVAPGFDATASGDGASGSPDSGTTSASDSSTPLGPDGSSKSSGYSIDITQTSVSGFSSGAFFAVQFHVAFSSILKGAAIFAGGPYDCAQDSATTAETTCLTGSPDVPTLVAATKQNYAAGTIDNPANLANERVFLFGGADDSVVDPGIVDSLNTYYSSFMSASSIQYESRYPGTAHTMPTLNYGSSCDSVTTPYVGKCSYDGAGNGLKQIYGTLAAPATTLSGKTLSFSQSAYASSGEGLAATGYYYVPASCASGAKCKIHVSFHGCQQDATDVGDAYYDNAGYNAWADTNDIIVLYPQATTSSGNDYGCWDFWGYDGKNYAEKAGTQLAAVRAMVDWLAGGGSVDGGAADSGSKTPPTDSGSTPPPPVDAGGACVTASNTAQVAAGRATALLGYAYAKGSSEYLGADTASTTSSLQELTTGFYVLCP